MYRHRFSTQQQKAYTYASKYKVDDETWRQTYDKKLQELRNEACMLTTQTVNIKTNNGWAAVHPSFNHPNSIEY